MGFKKISIKESIFAINVLNEVINGFYIADFETKIGVKTEQAERLHAKLLKITRCNSSEIYLQAWEVDVIRNAFTEVAKEIEEWEFSLRIGGELAAVRKYPLFGSQIKIELHQNLPIINILSEICYDSPVRDFENKLGVKEKDAQVLLDRLLDDVEKEVNEIYLEDWEVDLITNALAEVKKTIPADEFSKRIGMKIGEVEMLPIFKETR